MTSFQEFNGINCSFLYWNENEIFNSVIWVYIEQNLLINELSEYKGEGAVILDDLTNLILNVTQVYIDGLLQLNYIDTPWNHSNLIIWHS